MSTTPSPAHTRRPHARGVPGSAGPLSGQFLGRRRAHEGEGHRAGSGVPMLLSPCDRARPSRAASCAVSRAACSATVVACCQASCRDRPGIDPGVVPERLAERVQHPSPDHPGRAAALVGPGVTGLGERRPGTCTGLHRSPGGRRARPAAALHADPVVPVAGDRVHPAELVGLLADRLGRPGQQCRDECGGLPRLRTGRRDRPLRGLGGPTSARSRSATEPRRKAGVSAGAVHRRSSSPPDSLPSHSRVSEHPAMSKLVQNSPTSGSTTSAPAARSRRSMPR